jgi:cytochrome c oxidase cbb3-type subunit 3
MRRPVADLPGDFWGGWIAIITVASFVALVWIVVDIYRAGVRPEDGHEVWDETLREGTKPAPLWWFWFILALMSLSVVYLMLYPGLGTWRGALGWSQAGHYEARAADYDRRFAAARARLLTMSEAAIAADGDAMASASHIYANHCAACHGHDARGQASRFPDLRDGAWQWGGDAVQIAETIRGGRQAAMPPWKDVVGASGVDKLADYALALSAGRAGDPAVAEGGALYAQYCIACHGPDGSGNPMLGAPALNDAAWNYGGDRGAVIESIAAGRAGTMPAFGAQLDATQVRLLTVWLRPQAGR